MKKPHIRFGGPRPRTNKAYTLNEPVEVQSLTLDGRGVARHQGKTLFIRDALPGERVELEIIKTSKRYDEAQTQTVLSRSADRVEPLCTYYGTCGGCDLQHLASDRAIELKQQELLMQLKQRAQIIPDRVEPALKSDRVRDYRRTTRIGINQRETGELLIGFRRRASNKLVDIEHCPVLEPRINAFVTDLRDTLSQHQRLKQITQLQIIAGDTGVQIEIGCTKELSPEIKRDLISLAQRHSASLSLRKKGNEAVYLRREPQAELFTLSDNLKLNFQASDFVQANAAVNRLMIDKVLEWLKPGADDRVLDLFAGLGNFSLPLASQVKQLVAIEGSSQMVERCVQNALDNGLTNIDAYAADLSSPDNSVDWLQRKYDLILLDPPRQGASEIISALSDQKPRALVYIACDPASLVRDAATLKSQGYRMSRLCVADMFPQTHHLESLALFERI